MLCGEGEGVLNKAEKGVLSFNDVMAAYMSEMWGSSVFPIYASTDPESTSFTKHSVLSLCTYTLSMLSLRTLSHTFRSSRTLTFPIDPSRSLLSPTRLRTMASAAMSKRLEGKTIVITGASSGIGRSTAIEFARTAPKNLKLVLTARRIDTLREVAEEIKKEVGGGVKVLPFQLDVSKPEEVKSFVQALPEEFREIDVLVNNAYADT